MAILLRQQMDQLVNAGLGANVDADGRRVEDQDPRLSQHPLG